MKCAVVQLRRTYAILLGAVNVRWRPLRQMMYDEAGREEEKVSQASCGGEVACVREALESRKVCVE